MGKKHANLFLNLLKSYQEEGDVEALEKGYALLKMQHNLSLAEQERLHGYIEGHGRTILLEPDVLLTKESKFPGLDGQKMSKSYGNTIGLTEEPDSVASKIKKMPTDPARIKRTDPGDPNKCPVWSLHKVYSNESVKKWVEEGCRSAGIGCLDCKKPLMDSIIAEQKPIIEKSKYYEENPQLVKNILLEGTESARSVAKSTLEEVKIAMGIA